MVTCVLTGALPSASEGCKATVQVTASDIGATSVSSDEQTVRPVKVKTLRVVLQLTASPGEQLALALSFYFFRRHVFQILLATTGVQY